MSLQSFTSLFSFWAAIGEPGARQRGEFSHEDQTELRLGGVLKLLISFR